MRSALSLAPSKQWKFFQLDVFMILSVVVYVDDMIITSSYFQCVQDLRSHLHKIFGIKDLGYLKFFLGFEVGYVLSGITLTQAKLTKKLLLDSGITYFKMVATPLPLHFKVTRGFLPWPFIILIHDFC